MYTGTKIPVYIRHLQPMPAQDMARLDGTTITILEGPLVGRNVRFVVAVGVGEATQAGPLPRFTASTHPGRGRKVSDGEILGDKLQDCSQNGAPDATAHQLLASTVALPGPLANPMYALTQRPTPQHLQLHPTCAALMGSCAVCSPQGPRKVLACEIPSNTFSLGNL